MSMICNLRRASRDDITRLLAAPTQITAFLYGVEAPIPGTLSLLWSLIRRTPPATPAAVVQPPRMDGDEVDLDKAWHGLHFLFTGTAWEGDEPACFLVRGGEAIGSVDVGYGPARALAPDRVRRFAEFLEALSPDELDRRYDPARMTALDIYPGNWTGTGEPEEMDVLLEGFAMLRDFVTETREAGDALVVYLN